MSDNSKSLIGTKNKMGQTYADIEDFFNGKIPKEQFFMTGSEIVKEAVKRSSVGMSISYPITPQSEAAALVGELWVEGYVDAYFRGEHEFAVMSECAGASLGGCRVFTTTSGPGTLRAYENFPMWSGGRLPIMLCLMVRGINSPLSIQPDTIEIGMLLDTGMLIWHAEDAQELFDFILKGYVVAEQPDVHLPIAVAIDGFFVSHTKEMVEIPSPDYCLLPYDPYRSPVPVMDMETAPMRVMRDPFVMKSNYISYMTHTSWQLEIRAAIERSRKYTRKLMGGSLIDVEDGDAEIILCTSGTAVSQSREAIRLMKAKGMDVGLVKIKSIRPFPTEEVKKALDKAKLIVVPELNISGWMAKEIKSTIDRNSRVMVGPHVAGGMTMPPEIIVEEIEKEIALRKES